VAKEKGVEKLVVEQKAVLLFVATCLTAAARLLPTSLEVTASPTEETTLALEEVTKVSPLKRARETEMIVSRIGTWAGGGVHASVSGIYSLQKSQKEEDMRLFKNFHVFFSLAMNHLYVCVPCHGTNQSPRYTYAHNHELKLKPY